MTRRGHYRLPIDIYAETPLGRRPLAPPTWQPSHSTPSVAMRRSVDSPRPAPGASAGTTSQINGAGAQRANQSERRNGPAPLLPEPPRPLLPLWVDIAKDALFLLAVLGGFVAVAWLAMVWR